jgi:hypothetical protein
MKKVISAGLLTASLVISGSAIASAGSNLCPSNRACIYIDKDFVGLLGYRSGGGGLINLSDGANDKMTSWENKTSNKGAWYEHINGDGFCRNMPIDDEIAEVSGAVNDTMSSWRMNGGC